MIIGSFDQVRRGSLRLGYYPPTLPQGGGGVTPVQPAAPALKLADNQSYLLLASGGHLLAANG